MASRRARPTQDSVTEFLNQKSGSSKFENLRLMIHRTTRMHEKRAKDGKGHPFPRIRRLVVSKYFQVSVGLLIIFNCVFIGWQAAQDNLTDVMQVLNDVAEHFFTAAFVLELGLRIFTYGWTMLLTPENYLDLFLVLLSVLTNWVFKPARVDFDLLRKLTMVRTLRLVRLARAVRLRPEFREMWRLLKGLTESGETLFWTFVMIAFVSYLFAVMATALIGKQKSFKNNDLAQEYFGTVPRSMLTMFQAMTLDAWGEYTRPLMQVEWWVGPFIVVYITISHFVLMNLITAVIVENAFSEAKNEEKELAVRKEQEKEQELQDLRSFFEQLDMDGSGKLDKDEFFEATKLRTVRRKLRALGLMPKDVIELWDILDMGDGELDAEEFVHGIRELRGEAKSKDMLRMYRELRVLDETMTEVESGIEASQERMLIIKEQLRRARIDISAFQRTIVRAKEAVKLAGKTQPLS